MSSMPLRNALLPSASGLCALAFGALALMPMGHADAAVHTVTNCNDNGPGSLRNAVGNALDGDTINLRQLACSRILVYGEMQIPQNNLTLIGRSRNALTIDGRREHRVLRHTGTGILRLRRVSIANGHGGVYSNGGCILSQGSVELIHARVHHCKLQLPYEGDGGGIHASNRVLLSYSSIFASIAERDPRGGPLPSSGHGGGVRASEVVLYHSQVYGNRATSSGGGISAGSVTATYSVIGDNQSTDGGGIEVGCAQGCTFTLNKSTVSGNRADSIGGGFEAGGTDRALIIDSTLSDNIAVDFSAGALPIRARIFNSTIAFNQETGECNGAINARPQLRLVSSIVSGNTCNMGTDLDIGAYDGDQVTGSNNIIGTSAVPVPPDTILAAPRLGPLTDNGGPTPTHMPAADSPALDRGINPLNCQYDQRGPGFPRVKGGFPDIGAVER